MKRNEFIRSVCLGGVCSCMALPMFADDQQNQEASDKKVKQLEQRITFVQTRMAKLVGILDEEMGDEGLTRVLDKLGRECSKVYESMIKKYEKNLDGFLQMVQKDWGMKVEHDKEKKLVMVIGEKTGKCFCPFVKESLMSADFCNCSLGWQQQTFSTVIGKPVRVRVVNSVLRGAKSCDFAIDYA